MAENDQRVTTLKTIEELKAKTAQLIEEVVNAPFERTEKDQARLVNAANCAQRLLATLSNTMNWEASNLKKDKKIKTLLERLDKLEAQQTKRF